MATNPQVPPPHGARVNQLLAALSLEDFEPFAGHLELVPLRLGDVVFEPGRRLTHAYFPTTAIVSLRCVTASGASLETAGVGSEGMVGIGLFMGADSMASFAVVQIAGAALRLEASLLKREFERAGAMHRLLLRYAQSLITQIGQNAVCNRHHSIEQQLCRWLLWTLDRTPSAEMVMTHELVANTLGVRRESITGAAIKLQDAGVIRYRRGHISVLDRVALEARACECYAVVRKESNRLLTAGR